MAENPEGSTRCSVCMRRLDEVSQTPSERFRRESEFYPRGESMMPRFKSQTPIYAGVILVVNGIMGIGTLLYVNLRVSMLIPQYASEFAFYSAIVGGLSIFVLLGGAMTMTRKYWGVCIAASIGGIFLSFLGVFCGVLGLMLSIAGLVFVALAKKEFDS